MCCYEVRARADVPAQFNLKPFYLHYPQLKTLPGGNNVLTLRKQVYTRHEKLIYQMYC